jgi:hypothetical protein
MISHDYSEMESACKKQKEKQTMNRQQRRAFKIHATHVPDAHSFDAESLKQAAIWGKAEQTIALVDAERGRHPQALTRSQRAGPFKEPYTAQLLLEVESGETSVKAIRKMKQMEDDLMPTGAWKQSPYYTSFCEALNILDAPQCQSEEQPKHPPDQDPLKQQASHMHRMRQNLRICIEAEAAWLAHLHETGIDTSEYPAQDVFIPELGITHHQVFCPDALKERFHQWLNSEYFPKLTGNLRPKSI